MTKNWFELIFYHWIDSLLIELTEMTKNWLMALRIDLGYLMTLT